MNQSGSVIAPVDQKGEVLLQTGSMKVKIHVSQLSLDETFDSGKANAKKSASKSTLVKSQKSKNISAELDIRGCLVEEGTEKADKYLDDAFLAGLPQVSIIHGKGTGALRAAIHDLLKRRPHVRSYRLGQYGEGEHGVTIVELE
jgi:DNA mismatch repair protein MutS2